MHFSALIVSSILSFAAAAPTPVDWSTVDYSGVDWNNVDYSGVDWSKVDYSNVDWSKVDYSNVDWSKIDWSKVNYGESPAVPKPTQTSVGRSPDATGTFIETPVDPTTVPSPNGPYNLLSIRSGSALQYAPLYVDGTLRVGGTAPDSYSPAGVPVPVTNQAAFNIGGGKAALAVAVPGGQQLYVKSDGTIGYTVPHSAQIPADATTDGFSIAQGSGLATLKFNDQEQFLACPLAGAANTFEVVVDEKSSRTDCTGISVAGSLNTGYPGAWQW